MKGIRCWVDVLVTLPREKRLEVDKSNRETEIIYEEIPREKERDRNN